MYHFQKCWKWKTFNWIMKCWPLDASKKVISCIPTILFISLCSIITNFKLVLLTKDNENGNQWPVLSKYDIHHEWCLFNVIDDSRSVINNSRIISEWCHNYAPNIFIIQALYPAIWHSVLVQRHVNLAHLFLTVYHLACGPHGLTSRPGTT